MRTKFALTMLVAAVAAGLIAGCGDSETTTVIRESDAPEAQTVTEQTKTVTEKAPQQEQAPAPEASSEPSGEPPDVVGLTLPTAQNALRDAGYKADVSNTDAALGILVPENYTVCEQSAPVGNLVPILAQKEGC